DLRLGVSRHRHGQYQRSRQDHHLHCVAFLTNSTFFLVYSKNLVSWVSHALLITAFLLRVSSTQAWTSLCSVDSGLAMSTVSVCPQLNGLFATSAASPAAANRLALIGLPPL